MFIAHNDVEARLLSFYLLLYLAILRLIFLYIRFSYCEHKRFHRSV